MRIVTAAAVLAASVAAADAPPPTNGIAIGDGRLHGSASLSGAYDSAAGYFGTTPTLGGDIVIKAIVQNSQVIEDQIFERCFERRSNGYEIRISAGVPQPLVAFFEHLANKLLCFLEIVVQMKQQVRQGAATVVGMAKRVPGGVAIQVAGVLRYFRHCAESREPGHAPRDSSA